MQSGGGLARPAPGLSGAGGPPIFWGQATVAGRPRVLVLDATHNREGWEAESCARVSDILVRRDIPVLDGGPITVGSPDELESILQPHDRYNCIFLCANADGEAPVGEYWAALRSTLDGTQKLLAVCTWQAYDQRTTEEVLAPDDTFAVLAVSQQSPMTVRAAALFYMKFFAELDLHAEATDSMTGKMVWFGHSKAREILRRRHYEGRVGLKA